MLLPPPQTTTGSEDDAPARSASVWGLHGTSSDATVRFTAHSMGGDQTMVFKSCDFDTMENYIVTLKLHRIPFLYPPAGSLGQKAGKQQCVCLFVCAGRRTGEKDWALRSRPAAQAPGSGGRAHRPARWGLTSYTQFSLSLQCPQDKLERRACVTVPTASTTLLESRNNTLGELLLINSEP